MAEPHLPTSLPTVADVLALEIVRQGNPRVVAGVAGLDRPVRWVHVTELTEVNGILRGGELVLSTAIAWPDRGDHLERFIRELSDLGAAGLMVELGRRYPDALPWPLIIAADQHRIPVITLNLGTRFVGITESVHALIIDAQLAELRASEEVHQAFNELAVEGAEPDEVIGHVARMSGLPVVLETLAHQVLAYDSAGLDAPTLLEGWEARSRGVRAADRTGFDPKAGWLTTIVGARGHDWGRLVVVAGDVPPTPRVVMLLERAASTLALNRLIRRDRATLEQQTHRTLLTAILDHGHSTAEIALRSRALGVPLDGRRLVGLALRVRASSHAATLETQGRLRELTDYASSALRERRLKALLGALDEQSIGLLMTLGPRDSEDAAIEEFATAVRRLADRDLAPGRNPGRAADDGYVLGVGSSVGDVREARRSLQEAIQVADAAARQNTDRPYHRLVDVRLRGLLHLLRDDPRLHTYIERELGPLLAYDSEHGTELVRILGVYLANGRNKSAAADAAHLSRPSFYERLHRIEKVLAVDLDSIDSCLALHVALFALEAVRG